ncbi:MAG: hypothetical protein QXJ51_00950 [Sulfolobales archaeon]
MLLITTSRRASRRSRSLARDLSRIVNSQRINRGKLSLKGVMAEALVRGCKRILIVNTFRGNPGSIDIYAIESLETGSLQEESLERYTIRLRGRIILRSVRLSREISGRSCGIKDVFILDRSSCTSETCDKLIMLLKEILPIKEEERSIDVYNWIYLKESHDSIQVSFKNNRGEICGPIISVAKIILYDQGSSQELYIQR